MTPTPTTTSEAFATGPSPTATQYNATSNGDLKPETMRTILGLILTIACVIVIIGIFGYLSEKKEGRSGQDGTRRALGRPWAGSSPQANATARHAATSEVSLRSTRTGTAAREDDDEPLPLYKPRDQDASRPPSFVERPPGLCPPSYLRVPLPNVPPAAHHPDESAILGRGPGGPPRGTPAGPVPTRN
ncbi:hypothetical protein PHLGIDRAFT_129037 [Phlebiopsis gigantea 11061_1 CR5-6]|uniref:Uncharacterized protein n=1 Tax=Phlebiopsis gigantea (strain 11061_1 CR5-6) TaxID=745531 RepID=A0A0C3PH65_PHLG1|nr:hypothetical protein PHLGIDRAFT_129037 [Phlebiopsis gigantea 11061_1 CR5-6]